MYDQYTKPEAIMTYRVNHVSWLLELKDLILCSPLISIELTINLLKIMGITRILLWEGFSLGLKNGEKKSKASDKQAKDVM